MSLNHITNQNMFVIFQAPFGGTVMRSLEVQRVAEISVQFVYFFVSRHDATNQRHGRLSRLIRALWEFPSSQ